MEPVHVFVYGTLKRGYGNNRLLSTSSFVGEAVTCEEFKMVNHGFPYINRANKGLTLPVIGEVWKVSDEETLQRLDWLEGVSHGHYSREVIDVQVLGGETMQVFTYLACHSLDENPDNPHIIFIDEQGNPLYRWDR